MRGTWLLLMLMLPTLVFADIYRCEKDGKPQFQDHPCIGVESRKLQAAPPPLPGNAPPPSAPLASSNAWPEKSRETFLGSFTRDCLAKRHQDIFSKRYWTETQMQEFCDCSSERIMQTTTMEDFGKAFQTQDYSAIQPKAQAASEFCIDGLSKKWARARQKPKKGDKI